MSHLVAWRPDWMQPSRSGSPASYSAAQTSSHDDVFHRRQSNTVFEGTGEVTPARGNHIRQVIDIHFRFEIRFDIREGPLLKHGSNYATRRESD